MRQPLYFLLLAALLTGCTASRTYSGLSAPVAYGENNLVPTDRKVLREASLELRVDEPDTTIARLVDLAGRLGGYPEQTTGYFATLRVPDDRLEAAMDEVATYGKVTDRQLSTTDITDSYRDLGIRLDNAERARQRYLALLDRADTVPEAIEVERELERLNETIDLLKGQRNRMDNGETLATLTVAVRQREKLGPLGYVFVGLWKGVSWLFVRN